MERAHDHPIAVHEAEGTVGTRLERRPRAIGPGARSGSARSGRPEPAGRPLPDRVFMEPS